MPPSSNCELVDICIKATCLRQIFLEVRTTTNDTHNKKNKKKYYDTPLCHLHFTAREHPYHLSVEISLTKMQSFILDIWESGLQKPTPFILQPPEAPDLYATCYTSLEVVPEANKRL